MNHKITKALLCAAICAQIGHAGAITFSAAGANSAAIQGTVDSFRLALGTLNPNVVGSVGTGRREINWDGVPDAFSAPNLLPGNFFNSNSPRGVVFSGTGVTGFEVSATAASGQGVRFDNINNTYSGGFQTFSAQRLFTSLGVNAYDVSFFIPGSTTSAYTSAFGAVFADVDNANTTSIQYFDLAGNSLGTFFVPTANGGLSFLGIRFDAGEQVGRVRITAGNAVLGPNDAPAGTDVVVADDFIFAEPVPEPSTLTLGGLGAGLIALVARKRAKRQ